jgi:hypothetical protein
MQQLLDVFAALDQEAVKPRSKLIVAVPDPERVPASEKYESGFKS